MDMVLSFFLVSFVIVQVTAQPSVIREAILNTTRVKFCGGVVDEALGYYCRHLELTCLNLPYIQESEETLFEDFLIEKVKNLCIATGMSAEKRHMHQEEDLGEMRVFGRPGWYRPPSKPFMIRNRREISEDCCDEGPCTKHELLQYCRI